MKYLTSLLIALSVGIAGQPPVLAAPATPTATAPARAPITPDAPDAGPPTTSKTAHGRNEREVALNRPSRGGHSRVVTQAARVPAGIRDWAECVVRRESGGTLDRIQSGVGARNPSSSASGKFQFLDNSWRRGLSFMVRDRLVRFGMPRSEANKVRRYLGARPISEWHGYWQTIGFLEVVHRGGRHHWNGGSHSC